MRRIDPVIASLLHKSMDRDFERKETLPMTNEPEPNTRPLPQPSELVAEVKRLTTLADDHFRNARRLSEVVVARDAQIAKLQADGDKLAEALEAFQRHYDLNDCDERCGALEVPISDLRRATQALAAKGDSRG